MNKVKVDYKYWLYMQQCKVGNQRSPATLSSADAIELLGKEYYEQCVSRGSFPVNFKRLLWNSSDRKCTYCGSDLDSYAEMSIDHINPKRNGGSNHAENLACACRDCNGRKGKYGIDKLRLCLALKKSPIAGIINPREVSSLIMEGCILPLKFNAFYFEIRDKK